MKKGLRNSVLSLATLLALVSCGAPAVTEEVAKQRAQEITTRREQEDFALPTKLTITAKSMVSMTMKMADEKESAKETINASIVLDLDNYYYYTESSTSEGTSKMWAYLEDNTFILAEESANGKVYQEVVLEDPTAYIDTVSSIISDVYAIVLNNEFLQIENLDDVILQNTGLTGTFDSDLSYTSSAEGNLGISAKGSIKDGVLEIQEGVSISASANVQVKVNFDNYLLTSATVSANVKAVEETVGLSVELVNKETVNIKYGAASLSKPNLSTFTKQ